MSVQTQISRITAAVGVAYDAVKSKGGTAPAAQTIEGLAAVIGTIQTGIALQLIVTVSAGATVTATKDYFFLLSEFEVFGSISRANSNEASKQAQYAYYSAGNSKVKYKHNGTSTAARWWLRSPLASSSDGFENVNTNGTVEDRTARASFGFPPGFCV